MPPFFRLKLSKLLSIFAVVAAGTLSTQPVLGANFLRQSALLGTASVCEIEASFVALARAARSAGVVPFRLLPIKPSTLAALEGKAYDPETGASFGVTGRFMFMLTSLRLLTYNFAGKKVLSVANGESRLTQFLNLYFGSTGTVATALDLFSKPYLDWGANYVQGDAFNMKEIASQSQDLTIAGWFLDYFLARTIPGTEVGDNHKRMLEALTDEVIRVTKDGGDIRFGLMTLRLPRNDSLDWIIQRARANPRVQDARVYFSLPSSVLIIRLKEGG